MPNLVAQEVAQRAIELRRHSSRGRLGFAQRGDLQEQRRRIDIGMIVWQQIERHGRDLRQQFVERGRIGGRWNVIAVPLQTEASSSQVAEMVKMTGFDTSTPRDIAEL